MLTLLFILALPLVATDTPAPVDDSPASLFAEFHRNFRAFRSLKLQWRRDETTPPEWSAHQADRIMALEKEAAGLDDDASGHYHEIQQEIQRLRQSMANLQAPRHMVAAFRTDRSRFLVMGAPDQWDSLHAGNDWALPDVPISPESLKSAYHDFWIVSYAGDPTRGFFWTMPTVGGAMSVQVRRANYQDGHTDFPPLGVEKGDWGPESLWHPIDIFFRADPRKFATIGREAIRGRSAVLIERRTEAPDTSGLAAGAKRFEVVRAWLDPERGALPLKITWSFQDEVAGKPPVRTPVGANPWKVLETTEIVEVKAPGTEPDGRVRVGSYPTRGTITLYGPDFRGSVLVGGIGRPRPVRVTMAGGGPIPAGPGATPPFAVVQEVTTWEVAKIVANTEAAGAETYKIPIPKGTYYYDESQNSMIRAGYENENPAKLPWALSGAIVSGWAIYGVVALARRRRRAETPTLSA